MSTTEATPTVDQFEDYHNHDFTDDLDDVDETEACGVSCNGTVVKG